MIGYIYVKKNEKGKVFYVGSTVNLYNRKAAHKSELHVIQTVEINDRKELYPIEKKWVEKYVSEGVVLENKLWNEFKSMKNSPTSTIVRISRRSYNELRKFCIENDFKIGAYAEAAALEKIEKERKKSEKLPSK